ncbi:hypothetical protein ABTX61_12875 [Amycolatopsis japonica]|uniref:DUF6941 family protein n=1 Tax=Amycolatopsis japonica TaxID=208439 RepID=UPI00332BA9A6
MKAQIAVLCDKATVREGLLHILGGGVSLLGRPQLPAKLDVDLALLLQPETVEELNGTHQVSLSLATEGGEQLMRGVIGFEVGTPDEIPDPLPGLPLAVPLRDIPLKSYGVHVLSALVDDKPVVEIRFRVDKTLVTGVTESLSPDQAIDQ